MKEIMAQQQKSSHHQRRSAIRWDKQSIAQRYLSFQISIFNDEQQCDQIGRFIEIWATFQSLW